MSGRYWSWSWEGRLAHLGLVTNTAVLSDIFSTIYKLRTHLIPLLLHTTLADLILIGSNQCVAPLLVASLEPGGNQLVLVWETFPCSWFVLRRGTFAENLL